MAASTPPSGPTCAGRRAWPSTSRRPLDEGIHEELLAWMDAAPGELPRLRRLRRVAWSSSSRSSAPSRSCGPWRSSPPGSASWRASCTCPRAPSPGCWPPWSSSGAVVRDDTTQTYRIGEGLAQLAAPMDFTTVAGRVHQAAPRPAVVGHRRGRRVLACPRATRCTTSSRSTAPGRSRSATTRGPRRRCTSRPPACASWPSGRRPSSAATCHARWSATPGTASPTRRPSASAWRASAATATPGSTRSSPRA